MFTDYWPNIGLGKISVPVLVADMSIQIYQQKYQPGALISIGISWTHFGPTLDEGLAYNP